MKIRAKLAFTGIEGLKAKQINDVVRESMRDVGSEWHDEYLPLHFGDQAVARYNYSPREGENASSRRRGNKYVGRKLKKKGHNRPLEYSGAGKREALAQKKITAKAVKSGSKAHVSISLPAVFNLKNPKSKFKISDEIRRVLPSELKKLESFLVARLEKRFTDTGKKVGVSATLTG